MDADGTSGQLDLGDPIFGATVRLTAIPVAGTDGLSKLSGRVPPGATSAVIGLRANTEGAGPGPVSLQIYKVSYLEGAGSRNRVPDPHFTAGPDRWGRSGTGRARFSASDRGAGPMLSVNATPDQVVLVDSSAFPVRAGAHYTLSADLAIPVSVTGNAYLAVIFLHGTEIARHRLDLIPAPIQLGPADAGSGTFELRGLRLQPGRYRVRGAYQGDADHWPSAVATTISVR